MKIQRRESGFPIHLAHFQALFVLVNLRLGMCHGKSRIWHIPSSMGRLWVERGKKDGLIKQFIEAADVNHVLEFALRNQPQTTFLHDTPLWGICDPLRTGTECPAGGRLWERNSLQGTVAALHARRKGRGWQTLHMNLLLNTDLACSLHKEFEAWRGGPKQNIFSLDLKNTSRGLCISRIQTTSCLLQSLPFWRSCPGGFWTLHDRWQLKLFIEMGKELN